MAEPGNHKERFLALLSQLAEHFKDEPDDLLFEILNEPHENLTPELWNSYLAEAIAAYRSVDPQRTLVIGTAEWGGIGSLHKLVLPDTADNLIVTVHYYNPFHFTHQGAEWVSGSDEWLGTTWRGYTSELKSLEEDFDQVASWASEHNRPVFVGEFGAYNKADMTSRAAWTKAVRREAEERGMSWSYWEFCAGFGIYNTGDNSWNTELLNALIPQ
jgi:endoglucanase